MRDGASHAPYVPFQTSIEREDTQETAMTRPFEGIRVIDVTHVLAGPFATYQLCSAPM
jgi:hypothetical protein